MFRGPITTIVRPPVLLALLAKRTERNAERASIVPLSLR